MSMNAQSVGIRGSSFKLVGAMYRLALNVLTQIAGV